MSVRIFELQQPVEAVAEGQQYTAPTMLYKGVQIVTYTDHMAALAQAEAKVRTLEAITAEDAALRQERDRLRACLAVAKRLADDCMGTSDARESFLEQYAALKEGTG